MQKSIVLSDELLKEYHAFKHNNESDTKVIESLFSFYKPHITNIAQLKRIGIIKGSMINSLLSSGLTKQTLLGLSDKTKYKLILDKEKFTYPFVNIFKDEIENNYTATYKKNPRTKAQEHIKALLKDAYRVFIYDTHIEKQWNYSKKFFTELLPKKDLMIYYTEGHLNNKTGEIKKVYPKTLTNQGWQILSDSTNKNHRKLHDRYIIIDNKIEIILTSGFDNLFDERSDFTYIIRDLENE